jgi:hypothetical protein
VEAVLDALVGNGEDADLDVGRVLADEGLEVPDDLLDGEGDLLDGLEADDIRDLLGLDGGSLANRAKAMWPGTETAMAARDRSYWLTKAPMVSRVTSSASTSGVESTFL